MALLHECETATDVIENYKAVRSRMRQLRSPPPRPVPVVVEPGPIVRKIEITEMPQDTTIVVHQQEVEPRLYKHPSVSRIIGAVCTKYNVSKADLLSARRSFYIVRPRQVVMYLAKNLTLRSYPDIGRVLDRDHTSVLHGVRKIAKLRAAFRDLDKELTELETILGGGDVD